ncbi:hypothetical protein MIR68_009527 [Amoeboaphelidium protococcarum]|nr:hypothetical protein MIR68_009527 [Amoeboaphelidium protococcarum]
MLVLPLVIFSLAYLVHAGQVQQKSTVFKHAPENYFFFKNSEVLLLHERISNQIWRSADAGWSWYKASGISEGTESKVMIEHPFDNQKAFVVTNSKDLYMTSNRGESWSKLSLPLEPMAMSKAALQFHATRSPHLLFLGRSCPSSGGSSQCYDEAYYSRDDGKSWKSLKKYVSQCVWANGSPEFQSRPVDAIFCSEHEGKGSSMSESSDLRLLYSEDYFVTEKVHTFDNNQMTGVVGIGFVSKFFVTAVKQSSGSDLDLYVSVDGLIFRNSKFPLDANIEEDAYTILQSSAASLNVDVFTSRGYRKEFGTLYKSDSEGRYFVKSLENTNRKTSGIVDYERVQGVEGVALANIVSNPDDLRNGGDGKKKLESRISYDDGSYWRFINPPLKDVKGKPFKCLTDGGGSIPNEKCALHLHSVTSVKNVGRVFSDAAAPGIIMGVGNVGDYLQEYDDCDTFVSSDGGLNWQMINKGPAKFETGDQGALLVYVEDGKNVEQLSYSLNFGRTWFDIKLDQKLRVESISSDPESTLRKMILVGSDKDSSNFNVISLDFSKLHDRQCSDNDFEWWRARGLGENEQCLLGHYQDIKRRKQDAECYVGRDYKQPEMRKQNCQCTAENFECDYGYIADKNNPEKCVRSGEAIPLDGQCTGNSDEYLASSGYRKIPGDTCVGGVDLAKKVKVSCDNVDRSSNVKSYLTMIPAPVVKKYYMKKSQVILLQDLEGAVHRSGNNGQSFDVLSISGVGKSGDAFKVRQLFFHDTQYSRVYMLTQNDKVYFSSDYGSSFKEMNLPSMPNQLGSTLLDFHPTEKDWLLFIGGTKCPHCRTSVYVSKDNGATWGREIDTFVYKCQFSQDTEFRKVEKDAIFCSAYHQKFGDQDTFGNAAQTPSGNVLNLYKYERLGEGEKKLLAERVVQFYVYDRYLTVAAEDGNKVRLLLSEDGVNVVDAQFPPNTQLSKNAFTVVQSNTGSIMLDVYQSQSIGQEFGDLYSSNSNGTFYTLSLKNTNKNANGLVDLEQNQSLDGAFIANVVYNAADLIRGGLKKIKTVMSYDNGANWDIIREVYDTNRKRIECSTGQDCHLNLHGRADITWSGPIFSSKTAVGQLMGVGNFGPQLLDYSLSNTYFSRDGGQTWTEVKKGPHIFEFGDYGALLVMAADYELTDKLIYSVDDGKTWHEHKFYEKPVRVTALMIDSEGAGSKFLVLASVQKDSNSRGGFFGSISDFLKSLFGSGGVSSSIGHQQVVVQVDFSQAAPKNCRFNGDGSGDYEKWNPLSSDCILGQEMTYWRRKVDSVCHIGDSRPTQPANARTCTCSRKDYECDVGFWKDLRGECVLQGPDPYEPVNCRKGEKYTGRSGYRKISATKCSGEVSELEKKVERSCQESNNGGVIVQPPTDGKIGVELQNFDYAVDSVIWFDKSLNAVLKTTDGWIWQTSDGGSRWTKSDIPDRITTMVQNQYYKERVYFLTSDSKVHYYTTDSGKSLTMLNVPEVPNSFNAPILEFHAEEADWIIYTGNRYCPGSQCHTVAFYTQNNGLNWKELTTYVTDCEWARDALFKNVDKQMIFCGAYSDKSGSQHEKVLGDHGRPSLYKSDNFFGSQEMVFDNLVGFAISENFMVAALNSNQDLSGKSLTFQVSMDGEKFAPAVFPPGVDVQNRGFTVLEAGSGSVYLDMFKHGSYGTEWGTLFISNYNGTYYSVSLDGTNRNPEGFVDYEKMFAVEGVAIVNKVMNKESVAIGGKKEIKSFITYSQGAEWKSIKAPIKDLEGNSIDCLAQDGCSLNFHGYTERKVIKNEMSDEQAAGIFIGVGNVGKNLLSYQQSNVYLTTDAGSTWRQIQKGPHLFEFGDHGSVIVLVNAVEAVNYIYYSVTEGAKFDKYEFHPTMKIYADRFVTDPSGVKQEFLLTGRVADSSSGQSAVFKLDFSKLRSNQCILDTKDSGRSDFELWSVSDHSGNSCIFGHKTEYYRRKPGRNCYIGDSFKNDKIVTNCQCTEADFECDAGYYRDPTDHKCKPVAGEGATVWTECENGQRHISTGYRKHSLSTCQGGINLDNPSVVEGCTMPGRSSNGGSIAAGILIPLFAIAGLGLVYYRKRIAPYRYSIRLPVSDSTSGTGMAGSSSWRSAVNFSAVSKGFDAVRDLFSGLFTDIRARTGYRSVPLTDEEVHMENY